MGPDRSDPVFGFQAFFLFFMKKNTPTPATATTTTTMTITIQMGNPPLGDDASSNMTAYLEKHGGPEGTHSGIMAILGCFSVFPLFQLF